MRISSWSLRRCLKRLMACKGTVLCLVIALMFPHRFRWVYCQLEVLRQCFPSSVRCILAELPESLDETYERILQQIPKSNQEHAHRLLQCLTVAIRPLRVEELAEVLAIDFSAPGGTPLVDEKLRWEDKELAVLSACSSLICIQDEWYSRRHRVQFSHFSVKEFLTLDRLTTSMVDSLRYHHIHLESAHTIMAQACLSVLLRLDSSMDTETIEGYPLARYAAKHFGDHVEFENVLPHVTEGVDNLLDPDKPHFDTWVWLRIGCWIARHWHNSEMDSDYPRGYPSHSPASNLLYPPRVSPLYYVAAFGHFSLAHRLILKYPQDLHAVDDKRCTPLHIAVLAGKVEVSQLLIEHSINLDIRATEDWTLLHMAACRGLFEVSRILLERHEAIKACLNMRNKKGRTALHVASQYQHSSIVALLLKFGADVKAQDNDDMTPLHLALRGRAGGNPSRDESSCAIVQLLLEHGASVHVRDQNNQTPLHLASLHHYPSSTALLLKLGAEVDAKDSDNMTPLLFVLTEPVTTFYTDDVVRRSTTAQVLLDHGASVHMRNKKGQTPLHLALLRRYSNTVELLLKLGAEVDAKDNDNMTPLHVALMGSKYLPNYDGGRSTVAQVLLEHGASIHTRNKNGQTPLHLASRRRYYNTVALLLKLGAEVDAKDNDNMTPLDLALKGSIHRRYDVVGRSTVAQVLLEHGASVHTRKKNGQTPLHLASLRRSPNTVALLLKFGAEVDAKDNDNMTPLDLALTGSMHRQYDVGCSMVAQVLLEHGASVHTRNEDGQTPLHLASLHRFSNTVAVLLKFGAEVDAKDDNNMTPLNLALTVSMYLLDDDDDVGRSTVAQVLLEHGASVHTRNKDGRTPLHLTSRHRRPNTVALLLKFGAEADAKDNDNMTPLHLALTVLMYLPDDDVEHRTVAQVLLEHGASVHTRNKNGQTPLHLASLHRRSNTVALLLKLGAEVDAKDNDNMTPLHFAPTGPMRPLDDDDGRSTAAQVLSEHGASVHTRNINGQTPLHLASLHRSPSVVALLLKVGAEVDVRDNDNMTPLLLAPAGEMSASFYQDDFGCSETAQLLLVHGANVKVRNKNGQTPLHLASQSNLPNSSALLLTFGADVDAQDDDNRTPLHATISSLPRPRSQRYLPGGESDEDVKVKVKVIEVLLKHGANLQARNNKGETPFQIAAVRGEQKVIQLLSECMQNDHSM